ncbi:hypothetical protein D3C81_2079410 [compost metagenome]
MAACGAPAWAKEDIVCLLLGFVRDHTRLSSRGLCMVAGIIRATMTGMGRGVFF